MSRATEMNVNDFIRRKKNKNVRNNSVLGDKQIPVLSSDCKYLTPAEYAEILGIHPHTARCMCLGGGIEGAFKVGRSWRIPYAIKSNIDTREEKLS